jgi:Ca2+-binding RTX toxin-like protein
MIKKLVLGLSLALSGFLMVPVAQSAAPVPASYGFEICNEGWTVTESSDENVGGEWDRSPPGANNSQYASGIIPYPQGLTPDDPEAVSYEAFFLSPVHTFAAPGTITYWLRHNLETVQPPLEGGDFLYVELSKNGGAFEEVETFQGLSPTFTEQQIVVPSSGQWQLRYHLYSDNNTSGEGGSGGYVFVDDIVFEAPRPASATCDPPPADNCTKSGNGNDNTLRGTAQADKLCGKGGNDKLYGKGGKDVLNGGRGNNDKCYGGPGQDTFKGCETMEQ